MCWWHHLVKGASISSIPTLLFHSFDDNVEKWPEQGQGGKSVLEMVFHTHVCRLSSLIALLLPGQDLKMVTGLSTDQIRSAWCVSQTLRLCLLLCPLVALGALLPGKQRQETIQIYNWAGKLALKGKKEQLRCLNLEIWCRRFLPCSEQKYAEVSKLLPAQIREGQDSSFSIVYFNH